MQSYYLVRKSLTVRMRLNVPGSLPFNASKAANPLSASVTAHGEMTVRALFQSGHHPAYKTGNLCKVSAILAEPLVDASKNQESIFNQLKAKDILTSNLGATGPITRCLPS
jgi:hypothetical protein